MADGGDRIRADDRLFEPRDDDEQAGEHDQQRPVDVEIDLLRLHPPRHQQQRAGEDGDARHRQAEEEQDHHGEGDDERLDDQAAVIAHRRGGSGANVSRAKNSSRCISAISSAVRASATTATGASAETKPT